MTGYIWAENIGWIHFKNLSIPYKVQTAWLSTSSSPIPLPSPTPTGVVIPPSPPPLPTPNNLVFSYIFDEGNGTTVNDSPGNGNHGEIMVR